MTSEAARARRYLLRDASEEESLAIEREYFEDERGQEAIAAAEDDLIEDYLDDALAADERARFEREYLASAGHRRRVDTIRQLREAAATRGSSVTTAPFGVRKHASVMRLFVGVVAAAAVVILAIGVTVWNRARPAVGGAPRTATNATDTGRPAPPAPSSAPAAKVFAFTIPSDSLRSAGDAAVLVVPSSTDIVRLELPGESDDRAARASVKTASGDEVWTGPIERADAGATRIDVPASRLPPDDYVVSLLGAGSDSTPLARYVLHLRAR